VLGGPAPRSLDTIDTKVEAGKVLVIHTDTKGVITKKTLKMPEKQQGK
jgi:Rieske Fe-S protein